MGGAKSTARETPQGIKLETRIDLTAPAAFSLLHFTLARPEGLYYFFEVPGDPQPWQRAGWGKHGARNTSAEAQATIGWAAKVACRGLTKETNTKQKWGVRCRFLCSPTQSTEKSDVDNMLKNVLDGLKKIVYFEDRQVRETFAIAVHTTAKPRSEILAYHISPDYLAARSEIK